MSSKYTFTQYFAGTLQRGGTLNIRHGLIAVTLAGALLGSGGASAASGTDDTSSTEPSELIPVRLGGVQGGAAYVPITVALQQGAFEAHGLDVEEVSVTTDIVRASLESNSIDFSFQTPEFVATANERGDDLRIFCGAIQRNYQTIVVRADSPVPAASESGYEAVFQAIAEEDLTVGVSSLGTSTEIFLDSMLASAGIDPGDVDRVAVGIGASAIAAYDAGQVDALWVSPFVEQQLVASGTSRVVMRMAEDTPEELREPLYVGWIARKAWLDENAETAQRVCEALADAYAFVQDPSNADIVGEVLENDYSLSDPTVRATALEADGPFGVLGADVTCEQIDPALDAMRTTGVLEADSTMACEDILWQAGTR